MRPNILTKTILEDINMYDKFVSLLVEELQIDPAEITMEAELSNDLGINSIELADLVMICEEKFGITIEDDDIRKFTTVGDVVAYLETLDV
jgi:acyl carrier protein